MSDRDPDALWRPGFTGEVAYGRPPSQPRRRWLRRAAVLAAGLLVVGAGALLVRHALVDGAAGSCGARPRVPTQAVRRWQVDVPATSATHVTGSRDLVLLVADRQAIVALDGATGAVRWRSSAAGRVISLQLVGDRVLVQAARDPGDRVTAFDRDDGREVWHLDVDPSARLEIGGGQVLVAATAGAVDVIDPSSGATRISVTGADVTWDDRTIQRRVGSHLELVDRTSLVTVADVDLDQLGVPAGTHVAALRTPDGVVVADGDEAVLVSDEGVVRSSLPLPAVPAADRVRIDALDRPGGLVAVQRGDQLAVLAIADGSLRMPWSEQAWLIDRDVDAGLVALASVDGSIVTLPARVVDAATGALRWRGSVQRASPMQVFAADGVVAVERAGRRRGAGVTAYDLQHDPLWFRPIAADATAVLVDEGLVTVADAARAGTVTVALYG